MKNFRQPVPEVSKRLDFAIDNVKQGLTHLQQVLAQQIPSVGEVRKSVELTEGLYMFAGVVAELEAIRTKFFPKNGVMPEVSTVLDPVIQDCMRILIGVLPADLARGQETMIRTNRAMAQRVLDFICEVYDFPGREYVVKCL